MVVDVGDGVPGRLHGRMDAIGNRRELAVCTAKSREH